MNRNSNYIFNEKIKGNKAHAKKAQVGVDLSIKKIEEICGEALYDENSKLDSSKIFYKEAPFETAESGKVYNLEPCKNYAIEFEQGLETLKPGEWGLIIQRSSLLRTGCHIVSSIWDPGFGCDVMGTTLVTGNLVTKIPVGCRVAQILIFDSEEVSSEDLYNGRWQGKSNA